MTRNVLDEASQDVAIFAHDRQASTVARKMADHHSGLYHAEMVSLLSRQCLLDAVKQAGQADATTAHAAYDQDHAQQQPNRAESVQALQHKADAAHADAANAAIADGEAKRGENEQGATDGASIAAEKDMWPSIFTKVQQAQSVYVERMLYEIKKAGRIGFLKSVNAHDTRIFLGQALGMAERDGLITAAEVVAGAQPGTTSGFSSIVAPDSLTQEAEGQVATPVQSARDRLQKAEEKIRSLEEQLHLALQEITPVIADQDTAANNNASPDAAKVRQFITTYRNSPEYKAAQFELTAARKALGLEITDAEVNLAQHANDTLNPDTAKQAHDTILDSYQTLAASDQPEIAKAWVVAHRADSLYASKLDQQRLDTIDALATDTRANIAITNLRQIFASAATDLSKLDQAIAYLDANVVGPYIAFDKLGQLSGIVDLLKKQRAVWGIAHAKDEASALNIARLFVGAGEKDAALGRKLGSALGALMYGLGTGHGLVASGGDILAKGADIRDFYSKGKELRDLLRKSDTTTEQAAELAREVRGKYFTFSRGIGALALVGDVFAVSDDWNLASQYASPATYGKLVGDLMATVGDAMTLIPGLEPLGEAIAIVGTAISLIAGMFIGDPVGDQRRDATRQTLVDGGLVDPTQAQAVTQPDSAGNIAYSTTLKGAAALSPQQLQSLASTHAFLFADGQMLETAHAMWVYYSNKNDYGIQITGACLGSFFTFLKTGSPDDNMKLCILYCRPCVSNGILDLSQDVSTYGTMGMEQMSYSYPGGVFSR